MPGLNLSRREFAARIGSTLALAAATPKLGLLAPASAEASIPDGLPDTVIQLDANENPYGPAKKALEAMTRSHPVACRYPDGSSKRLVKAIADMHGIQPENVVLGCGSTQILHAADDAFVGPGKNAVAAEPTFEVVLAYAGVMHASTVKVPLTSDFRHDLPKMAAACTSKTGMVYVCNPNNPTGTIVGKDELDEFCQKISQSTVVIIDEAYIHFVKDPRYGSAEKWIARYPNLIVVRTFSKAYGLAGMRLGYAIGQPELMRTLDHRLTYGDANAAVLAAVTASLNDSEHIASCVGQIAQTKKWLMDEMARQGRRTIPSEANFMMIDVGTDVAPVVKAFENRNILVGRKFPSLSRWLRVSIGMQPEVETFAAALNEIVPAKSGTAA
jgi:histidinol-phosphate aminotransferase